MALGRTVAELLDSIEAAELLDWQAFYLIDPWGDQRADLRSAVVASAVVNANPFRSGSAVEPARFMLFSETRSNVLTTPEEMEAYFAALCAAYGD